jgi:hypothetical protein
MTFPAGHGWARAAPGCCKFPAPHDCHIKSRMHAVLCHAMVPLKHKGALCNAHGCTVRMHAGGPLRLQHSNVHVTLQLLLLL